MKKVNYLNNKDILKEIHKSKSTYCSFIDSEDHAYDVIIHDIETLKSDLFLAEARELRASRLAKEAFDAAKAEGQVVKADQFAIPSDTIPVTDVVVRFMTWEHIPEAEAKPKKGEMLDPDDEVSSSEYEEQLPIKYVKVNFPPFQHYKIDEKGQAICVGKSHWKGDLETGDYSRNHGNMTNKLAHMFIKLCERYATRSNWRGYTYNDEMRSQALLQLSQIGLQFDESKSQNPFAYYTAAITNSFTRVLNIEKRNQNIRDDILEMNGLNPSYTRQGMSGGSPSFEE
tara:strand:+ start:21065 stop:21919 length:855 start_codon:yes stop_codon:yes gene_type:complete